LLRASAGLSRQTTRSSRARIDLRTYRFKVGVVARSGQPFWSNDIAGDRDFDQRWVRQERLAAVAILPLVADEVSYGVLAAFFRVALTDDVAGALRMFSAIAAGCLAGHEEPGRDGARAST
jgi:GAF domain-containing protein